MILYQYEKVYIYLIYYLYSISLTMVKKQWLEKAFEDKFFCKQIKYKKWYILFNKPLFSYKYNAT